MKQRIFACRGPGQEGLTTWSQADSAVGEFLSGGSLGFTCGYLASGVACCAVGQGRDADREADREAGLSSPNDVPLQRLGASRASAPHGHFSCTWNGGKDRPRPTGHAEFSFSKCPCRSRSRSSGSGNIDVSFIVNGSFCSFCRSTAFLSTVLVAGL